jgi:predicted permease
LNISIFWVALNALLPVIALIVLGYGLKRKGCLPDSFLKTGNWLVFHVCFPAMLFINVYDIDSFAAINWKFVLYCIAVILVIFVLGMITAILVTPVGKRRGVIWQSTFRSNFVILGMAIAGALGGTEASALVAVTSSCVIPVFNVLAVVSLTVFAQEEPGKKQSIGSVLVRTVRNPHVVSILIGMACLGIREIQRACFGEVVFSLREDVKFLYTVLQNISSITTPFALLVLGGQFEFSAVRGLLKEIVAGTLWRIVLAPLLGIGGAILLSRSFGILHCGVNEYPALIAMFGSPVAVPSAVMAGSMGADEQLATQLVVWTSLFSIVTIFAEVCILMSMGLLSV